MQLLTSPRLPDVPILNLDATGPEYSRWRRSIKFALETKDMWKYCNGTFPMPMPKERPALARFEDEISDTQPCLLQERRRWMRQDREVKLDIFLAVAEEVMLDVFQVGPPLPPTKYTAQQMLEILDSRFSVFEFEGYHHAFCHFLNLRVDDYESLDEFNTEFLTVLEDLHDYGQPLSNIQACSAYFSKLHCTRNPWVAKKVEEWDAQCSEPQIHKLMQESMLWPYVKPLKNKSSQSCYMKPVSEGRLYGDDDDDDDAGRKPVDGDVAPELSDTSTLSSKTSHSRQLSETNSERKGSTIRLVSKPQFDPQALREALERIPAIFDSEKSSLHEGIGTGCTTPEWLSAKEGVIPQPEPQLEAESTQTDIPPLSLPPAALHKSSSKSHMRSRSAPISNTAPNKVSVPENNPRRRQTTDFTFRRATPPLSEHPAFRHRAWAPPEDLTVEIHPALRPMTPLLQPQKPSSILRSCSPLALGGSQRATTKRSSNRPRTHTNPGNSTSSQDTISKALFRSTYDYSLPPSPSSSSIDSSSGGSIMLKLALQETNLVSYPDTPSSCSPSPIAIAIPRSPSRSPEREKVLPRIKDQQHCSIQPPISIFSLATTNVSGSSSSSSLSSGQSPPPSPSPRSRSGRRKGMQKRFSNPGGEKEREKEKVWGFGVGKMGRLGTRGGRGLVGQEEE